MHRQSGKESKYVKIALMIRHVDAGDIFPNIFNPADLQLNTGHEQDCPSPWNGAPSMYQAAVSVKEGDSKPKNTKKKSI